MAYPLIIKPEAKQDLAHTIDWYNEQRPGLGEEFLDCVGAAFNRIRASPKMYAVAFQSARLATVKRFPYVVCYEFDADEVHVISVFHGHRDPQVWQERIT